MKTKNTSNKYLEDKEILNLRKFKRNALFIIYFRTNNYGFTRIGLLVSKKNGNAVTRNKIKRQLRSMIDQTIDYKRNIDLIILVSKSYNINKFEENFNSFKTIIRDI